MVTMSKLCIMEATMISHSLIRMDEVCVLSSCFNIKKFFENSTEAHRKELASQLMGHVLPLSLQMYGCRVIQKRKEFYEYSMVLGNSQSVLQPFQPYKIIYAYMLAEVGRLSDSLKYCQAILKSLKTNRSPEVEAWKQLLSSLKDRIRAHQQSGFGTNLAPRKLVGKFLPFIDSTIHRMIAPPPHPGPSGKSEIDNLYVVPRVANSQSTMAMQSLVPSESTEPISSWANGGSRTSMHNRSISEPDFNKAHVKRLYAAGILPFQLLWMHYMKQQLQRMLFWGRVGSYEQTVH